MLLTVVLEKTLESPLDIQKIKAVKHRGYQSWIFIGRTDAEVETPTLATWCEELTLWKRPWIWERLNVEGEGDKREWDSWMASLSLWTWVWANFRSWWWTGKPGVLQSMGLQRVRQDWVTELYWESLWEITSDSDGSKLPLMKELLIKLSVVKRTMEGSWATQRPVTLVNHFYL